MEIKFVEALPKASGPTGGPRPDYQDFANEMKKNPYLWAEFPRTFDNTNQCSNVVRGVKRSEYAAFRPYSRNGEEFVWQVAQRRGRVYIRTIPADETSVGGFQLNVASK